MRFKVTVGLSNKHVHLSKEHIDILFGEGYELTPIKDLTQPGQFACDEKVDLVGPKRTIKGVRILGPARKETQVELSFSDGFTLGITDLPVRDSGKTEGTRVLNLWDRRVKLRLKEVLLLQQDIYICIQQMLKNTALKIKI